MHNNIYKRIKNKGLTLVELMVVISIFLVITSTVIFNYGGFRSNISLQNLTDDIALSIRKAQSFAIGARGVANNFSNSYGVHFSLNPSNSGIESSPKSFLMFAKTVANKGYTIGSGTCGAPSNTCLESFRITSNDTIKSIVLNNGGIPFSNVAYLDIIFTRPDPKAFFCYRTSINNDCDSISKSISNISIVISNGQVGAEVKTKTISVQNTGQISIQ